jgi:hypothetical protein
MVDGVRDVAPSHDLESAEALESMGQVKPAEVIQSTKTQCKSIAPEPDSFAKMGAQHHLGSQIVVSELAAREKSKVRQVSQSSTSDTSARLQRELANLLGCQVLQKHTLPFRGSGNKV